MEQVVFQEHKQLSATLKKKKEKLKGDWNLCHLYEYFLCDYGTLKVIFHAFLLICVSEI